MQLSKQQSLSVYAIINQQLFLRIYKLSRLSTHQMNDQQGYSLKLANKITMDDQKELNKRLRNVEDHMAPLLNQLFKGGSKQLSIEDFLPIAYQQTDNLLCGARLCSLNSTRTTGFKCYSCQIHRDSIICETCFKNGEHSGHRYIYYTDIDGICDCGNPEILKVQGFCSNHCDKAEALGPAIIKESLETQYMKYIRSIFEWIFRIYECNYTVYAKILLKKSVDYLVKVNKNNTYFWQQNKQIFFTCQNNLSIIDKLIDLQCQYESRHEFTITGLIQSVLCQKQLQHLLFLAYLSAYGRNKKFATSRFFDHLKHLASQNTIVNLAYLQSINTQRSPYLTRYHFTLNYGATNNFFIYYEHLNELIDLMEPKLAYSFIYPLIQQVIPYPYLSYSYKHKFDDICQTEKLYYKLMNKIIGLVKDKRQLKSMMMQYLKLHQKYKKCDIDEFQMPPRIIAVILLQYFDYNLSNCNKTDLELTESDQIVFYRLFEVCFRQLLNFCKAKSYRYNISFEWSYGKYYVENHIIKYDMLLIQIVYRLFPSLFGQIQAHIINILKQESKAQLLNFASTRIQLKINLLILLSQIKSSKIPQLFFGLNIRRQDKHITQLCKRTIKAMFNTLNEISLKTFESINKVFFGDQITENQINQLASFGKKYQRYTVKERGEEYFNFNAYFSISDTEIYSLYREIRPHISYQQEQSKEISPIFNDSIVTDIISELTDNPESLFYSSRQILNKLIVTHKTLKWQYQSFHNYDKNVEKIRLTMVQFCMLQFHEENIELHYPESYHDLMEVSQRQAIANMKDKQLQQRKQKQRLKKLAILAKNKTKENQQIYKQQQTKESKVHQEEDTCTVCKLSGVLCFMANLTFTNLLFHRFRVNGENITIKTCKHFIHYECFLDLKKNYGKVSCPLCRQLSNTVIPLDLSNKKLLSVIGTYYQYLIEAIKMMKRQLREDLLLSLCCMLIINSEFKCNLTSQDELIIKFIVALYHHLALSHPKPNLDFVEMAIKPSLFLDVPLHQTRKYVYLLLKIIMLEANSLQVNQFLTMKTYSSSLLKKLAKFELIQFCQDLFQIIQQTNQTLQCGLARIRAQQVKDKWLNLQEAMFSNSQLQLPKQMSQFLHLRDGQLLGDKRLPYICQICKREYEAARRTSCAALYGQALLINTLDATLINYRQNQWNGVLDIYTNANDETWTIQKEPQHFTLNQVNYRSYLKAFINRERIASQRQKQN